MPEREGVVPLPVSLSPAAPDVRAWRFEQRLNRIEEFNKKAAEDAKAGQDK